MEPTAKVAITSIPEAMTDSSVSTDSFEMCGTTRFRPVWSASLAPNTAAMESTLNSSSWTHNLS
jgi:hypothetical protein